MLAVNAAKRPSVQFVASIRYHLASNSHFFNDFVVAIVVLPLLVFNLSDHIITESTRNVKKNQYGIIIPCRHLVFLFFALCGLWQFCYTVFDSIRGSEQRIVFT